MGLVHLWGLALFFLILGQTSQLAMVFDEPALACDAVGLSALAEFLDEGTKNPGKRTFFMALTRVLFENIPSGMIASSFLMFSGVQDLTEQPIALVSALLSAGALLKKGVDVLGGPRITTEPRLPHQAASQQAIPQLSPPPCVLNFAGLVIIGMGAWILAKLYFIQTCPDHAWQITSGCLQQS